MPKIVVSGGAVSWRVTLTVAAVFIAIALAGGFIRALRYDFGRDESDALIPKKSASASTSSLIVRAKAARDNCALTLYAGGIPFGLSKPGSRQRESSFKLAPDAWEGRPLDVVAECPDSLLVHRGLVVVSPPQGRSVAAKKIKRAIHLWISPGQARINAFLEAPVSDPQLMAALKLWSLKEFARQVFWIQVNGSSVFNALRNSTLRLNTYRGSEFLVLSGELRPYVAVPRAGEFRIRIFPAEDVDSSAVRSNLGNSRFEVTIKGFEVDTFPLAVSGINARIGDSSGVAWSGSVYSSLYGAVNDSKWISIGAGEEKPKTITGLHRFLVAHTSTSSSLGGIIVTDAGSLLRLVILIFLLTALGLWQRNERYCGVLAAAALSNALADFAQCLVIGMRPHSGEPSAAILAGILAFIFVAGTVLWMRCCAPVQARRAFLGTAAAVFAIALAACIYDAILGFHEPGKLSSSLRVILSQSMASIVVFGLLLVTLQPRRAAECFASGARARLWFYWIAVSLIIASAAAVAPSPPYLRPPTFGPPEYLMVVFAMQTTFYVSALAVIFPVLWYVVAPAITRTKSLQRKRWLALVAAILTILDGYAYLGLPLTLGLAVAFIYWIGLRPRNDYQRMSDLLGSAPDRETLIRYTETAHDVETAKDSRSHLATQFLSGELSFEDFQMRDKGLEDFVNANQEALSAVNYSGATELAFGLGSEKDAWANARFVSLLSLPFGVALTLLGGQSILSYVSTIAMPLFVALSQVTTSVVGYMAAGFAFGLAYPYLRGSIGTVKALWLAAALVLAVLPYEFLAGSRPVAAAQGLRWIVFFGGLGIFIDYLNARRYEEHLNLRGFLGIAGLGNFAAVGAVAVTIVTTFVTEESRRLLELAIHYAIPTAPFAK